MAKEKSGKVKEGKKVRNTAGRLTRADKIAKRLRGVSLKVSIKPAKTQFTFRVFAKSNVDINGSIVSEHSDSILFLHKRTNASKRMVVSRIARRDLVELFGSVGEMSSATVFREVQIREIVGKLIEDKDGVMTIQTASGETVKLYENADTRIEVSVEHEVEAAPAGKKSKKDKGDKADGKKKKKKSKPADDDDDDDLDD